MRVSEETFQTLNASKHSVKVPKALGTGRIGIFETIHQLHCLVRFGDSKDEAILENEMMTSNYSASFGNLPILNTTLARWTSKNGIPMLSSNLLVDTSKVESLAKMKHAKKRL